MYVDYNYYGNSSNLYVLYVVCVCMYYMCVCVRTVHVCMCLFKAWQKHTHCMTFSIRHVRLHLHGVWLHVHTHATLLQA